MPLARLVLSIPVWLHTPRRVEIFLAAFENWMWVRDYMQRRWDINVHILLTGSAGDPNYFTLLSTEKRTETQSEPQCRIIDHKNQPLGAKMNFGMRQAVESAENGGLEADYVVGLGSDDFLTERWCDLAGQAILKRRDATVLPWVHIESFEPAEDGGMKHVIVPGPAFVGAVLSKAFVRHYWMMHEGFPPQRNQGVDYVFGTWARENPRTMVDPLDWDLPLGVPLLVDLKSEGGSLNAFSRFTRRYELIDSAQLWPSVPHHPHADKISAVT